MRPPRPIVFRHFGRFALVARESRHDRRRRFAHDGNRIQSVLWKNNLNIVLIIGGIFRFGGCSSSAASRHEDRCILRRFLRSKSRLFSELGGRARALLLTRRFLVWRSPFFAALRSFAWRRDAQEHKRKLSRNLDFDLLLIFSATSRPTFASSSRVFAPGRATRPRYFCLARGGDGGGGLRRARSMVLRSRYDARVCAPVYAIVDDPLSSHCNYFISTRYFFLIRLLLLFLRILFSNIT